MRGLSAVTVVIPAHNEEKNIKKLLAQTINTLKSMKVDFEIVVVDDGSEDDTFLVAKQFACKNDEIVVIKHLKREGKSMALRSGFAKAKGDVIITIDADLQYDPGEIPCLLKTLEKGYDVVTGYRDFSQYTPSKVVFSKIYNKIASATFGTRNIHDLNCGLKAFRREVVEQLLTKIVWRNGIHRYLISLCAVLGYKITEVKVSLKQRTHGRSKYGLKRFVEGISLLLILFLKVKMPNFKTCVGSRTNAFH